MNDDFYILKPSKVYKYFDGLLIDKIDNHSQKYGNSSYARALRGAVKALSSKGICQPLNYEVHMPMALNKAKLAQVLDLSLSPRSLYGNIFISDGVELKDVKIYKDTNNYDMSANLISSEDNSFSLIKDQLHELFSNPSEFEL